jgi:hypothetical protein
MWNFANPLLWISCAIIAITIVVVSVRKTNADLSISLILFELGAFSILVGWSIAVQLNHPLVWVADIVISVLVAIIGVVGIIQTIKSLANHEKLAWAALLLLPVATVGVGVAAIVLLNYFWLSWLALLAIVGPAIFASYAFNNTIHAVWAKQFTLGVTWGSALFTILLVSGLTWLTLFTTNLLGGGVNILIIIVNVVAIVILGALEVGSLFLVTLMVGFTSDSA